jgi:hypothetical protein
MPKKTGVKPEPQPHGGALKRDAGPGRPKGSVSITNELKKVLAEDGNAEKMARAMVLHAAKGNGAAIKHILERVDGKVPDEVVLTDERVDLSGLSVEELHQFRALMAKCNAKPQGD